MMIHSAHPSIPAPRQPREAQETTLKQTDKTEKNNSQHTPTTHEANQALLSESDKKIIQELKSRDREVRAHEQAHKNAAGPYAKGISYQYQRGPDGIAYAVAGEVSIDTSDIPGNPAATLQKAQMLLAAALAPAQPSAQDYAVAAEARQMAMDAQRELTEQSATETPQPNSVTEYQQIENNNAQEQQGQLIDLYL